MSSLICAGPAGGHHPRPGVFAANGCQVACLSQRRRSAQAGQGASIHLVVEGQPPEPEKQRRVEELLASRTPAGMAARRAWSDAQVACDNALIARAEKKLAKPHRPLVASSCTL